MVNKIPAKISNIVPKMAKDFAEYYKKLNTIIGSEAKLMIIYSLHFNETLSKQEIHDLITEAGIKIQYKNTAANIDKLKELGVLNFKKGQRYNKTEVSLAKELKEPLNQYGIAGIISKLGIVLPNK